MYPPRTDRKAVEKPTAVARSLGFLFSIRVRVAPVVVGVVVAVGFVAAVIAVVFRWLLSFCCCFCCWC